MERPRHQARIVALQGLYQLDIQRAGDAEDRSRVLPPLLEEAGLTGPAAGYAATLLEGVWAQRVRFDEMIAGVSKHWDVSRMAVVDRNIIRLAIYELIHQPDLPVRVVMDEAIELGHEFGSAETGHFVNGVLDAIYKQHPTCRVARGESEDKTSQSTEREP